jgi:hypothetical protein
MTITGTTAEPTRFSYVAFEFNGSTALHTQNGASVELDHLSFQNTGEQYLSLDNSSFVVSDCVFPTATAAFELVHGSAGIAVGGRGIIQRCWFGKAQGYNDVIDFTGGNRPGPVLHVLNCTFMGSDDDILDLDGTDAWIEGNLFMHCHRNGSSPDSSSAISGGTDNTQPGQQSQVTALRNIMYDCDNAVTMKQGNSAVLLQNTIIRTTKAGGIDTGTGVFNFGDEGTAVGSGMLAANNIIWDAENLTRYYTEPASNLVLNNNILPVAWAGAGSGNIVADPMLNLSAIANPATATEAEVRAAVMPRACSPAIGAAPLGGDLGALVAAGVQLTQFPASTLPNPASIQTGMGGSFTPNGQGAWTYGYTHYKYALDAAPQSAEFPIGTPISLTTPGTYLLQVWGRNDSGNWDAVSANRTVTVSTGAPTVLINEILAENGGVHPLAGTAPDVVELYNFGTAAVDLADYSLSDNSGNPRKFVFPVGTTIAANGYLVVYADALTANPGIHIGFGLRQTGETVSLYGPAAAVGATALSTVTFGPQIAQFSIGRIGSGTAWGLSTPTIGAANRGFCDIDAGAGLRINEWLASNDLVVDADFVEIFNPSNRPVNFGNWLLTTDFEHASGLLAAGDSAVHRMPALSFIPATGFLLLRADGQPNSGGDHLGFTISRNHENLSLATATGALVDHVLIGPAREDESQGRTPDGAVGISYQAVVTPGFSNGSTLPTDQDLRNFLRITEIMYHPPGGSQADWIEFKNIGTVPLVLDGVRFTQGIDFAFGSVTVPAGGYAVVVSNAAQFTAQYPTVPIAGVFANATGLSNGGERLRYELGDYPIGILDFDYEDDWYPVTDGAGATLQIINPAAPAVTWDSKTSWQAGLPSPGADAVFGVLAGEDADITLPQQVVLSGSLFPGAFDPGTILVAWTKESGPGNVTFAAPASPVTNADFSLPGSYVLKLTATSGANVVSDTITITAADSFAAWLGRNGLGNNPNTDTDGDGHANLIEYALGTNPNAFNAGPELSVIGGSLVLRYSVPAGLDALVEIIPEVSADLENWSSLPEDVLLEEVSATPEATIFDATDLHTPAVGDPRHYLRLRVQLNP